MKNIKESGMCSCAYTEISLFDYLETLANKPLVAPVTKAAVAADWRMVVEKNLGLVHSRICKVYGVNANNRDDIEQAGMLALIKAAQGFNPALGNKFSSYAVPAIDRAMQREVSSLGSRILTDSLEAMQEDGDYKLGQSGASAPDEIYREAEVRELEQLVDEVCSKLTRSKDIKAVKAVAMQLRGVSPDDIARVSGLSRRSYTAYISIGRQILSANPHILSHISLADTGHAAQIEVVLLGERIVVKTARSVRIDLPARSGSAGGFSLDRLAVVMQDDDVADYLLGEVAIGEDVIILDDDTKCATTICMDTSSAAITSVWQHLPTRNRKGQCA